MINMSNYVDMFVCGGQRSDTIMYTAPHFEEKLNKMLRK